MVLTRNFNPTHPMLAVAEEMNLPIFKTPLITMNFVNLATLCIDNEFAPSSIEHATTLDIKGGRRDASRRFRRGQKRVRPGPDRARAIRWSPTISP